ncbi:MAG: hypothetical protein ABFE07_12305 [Armatimonadia bacterium]
MMRLLSTFVLLMVAAGPLMAQALDVAKLAEEFKAWDLSKNEGQGLSASSDSGTLAWGEAAYLRAYSDLWLVTKDTYWLSKIEDHFNRMIGNASDPDGDGFLGWTTATYSAAGYWAQPLCNMGTGTVEPPFTRTTNGDQMKQITGHVYVVEFADEATFAVTDQTTRKLVAGKQAYKDGAQITAVPGCKVTIKGAPRAGDKFMVRTMQPEPTEFVVHEGMVAHPVAVFIEAVAKDEKLKERFGASAEKFLQFMNRNFLQKHERDWVDLPDGAGGYRFADLITDRFPNRVMPHNQYLALARAFLVLKDVPGADPLMGKRAEQMAKFFRRSLMEQDAAWVWYYWDWIEAGEAGHSGFEDTSHGHIDIGFAIEAARRGVVFTDDDMKRFTRTVLDLMWNQSETDPKLGPTCAVRGDKFGLVSADWIELCQWDRKIFDLALQTPVGRKPLGPAAATLLRAQMVCGK